MGNLSNLYISQSFQSLAHLGTNNALVPGTMTQLEDGIGQSLNISFDGTNISSSGNIFAANLTGSASTGSFMLTGSVSVNVLTFTKADGSTFDLTVAASGSVVPGTISGSAQITALGFVSSSVTASSLITASFDNGTRNLTFTKGNNTTFNVNIPDVSGSTINTGSFVTTSSFNAYTASQSTASLVTSISNLNTFTSSANIRLNNLESTTASLNTSISNLNTATQSLFVSASLALVTASINNDDITFTKGDGSQFTIQVATGSFALSASYAETASYAQFATDIYLQVKNTTGAQLNKGTVVRIIGATGDNALIATASWEDDNNSANTLGFLYENIANDAFGKVITQGTLLGIDTDPVLGYTAGQIIYLSSSGQYTNVIPPAPYHEVRLGQVLRAQQNNGSIYVLIQNGYELSELHDVDINTGSLANNDLLAYNTATLQWENKTLTQVGATTTSSFNSYTSSTNSRLTNIESTTASLLIETQNLELFSASALISISNLNASSASQQISINNLNTATSSLFTSASLSLTTASVSGQTMTFTKGDGTTFNVTLPAGGSGSIDTASFATTGSNTFTGSQIITGSITTTQDITISSVRFGFGNTAGTSSIAIGNSNTLQNNTGQSNVAIGVNALNLNVTGNNSVAIGTNALQNALANNNTGIGADTLKNAKANSDSNTAIGQGALENHFDGDIHSGDNMAFGLAAMQSVTSGSANTAIGTAALRDAARANENVFIGWISGINASGSIDQNVVIGPRAGQKMAGSSNTIIGHNAASELVNGGTNVFIGQGAGALIVTGSSNTLIGSIAGVDNWNNVIAIAAGNAIKTKFQSDIWEFTGSVDIQNTLTASLQQGFTYVGDASGRTTLVATSSFGGGGTIDTASFATTGSNSFRGTQTFVDDTNFSSLVPTSGSLMLVAKSFTSSSLHLTSSFTNSVNLIFKNNNNTADTIISGSNNIFLNPVAPTAGFKRYIGNNNIALGGGFPQISGSMGFSPAVNTNYLVGGITMRGPVSSSAWTISANNILGTINIGSSAALHAEKIVSGLTMTSNNIAGTLNIVANQSALTGSTTQFLGSVIAGNVTLNLSSSAVNMANNIINDSGFTFTNQYYSSSAGLGTVVMNRNNIGGQSNTIIISGSLPVGGAQSNSISDNFIFGGTNTIYIDVANARVSGSSVYKNVIRTGLMGNNLIVSGSSLLADNSSYGSVFVGRYNANDNIRNKTSDVVFAVGTGNTTTRKTGFLIDSGSNTFVEGTFNVSGSSSLNGNVNITGSLTASLQEGFVYVGNASGITTTVSTSSLGGGTINTGSFATTGSNTFNGNQTITGSVSITGSLTTAGNMFQVTGSFNTFGNVITQLGVFTSSLAGGLEIDGIGYVGSGSAGAFFINSTTQDIKIQNYYSSSVNGKNIVIENFSQTGSAGMHGKVVLRARGTGGAVTVENSSQFRVECQTEITGSLIVSGSLAAANNIKMGRGTDKPTNKVTVGSGGLIVSNSLVTADSYIFATNDTTVGNYSPIVSNITAGSFSLSNGGYGGNISVMYMIVNPY